MRKMSTKSQKVYEFMKIEKLDWEKEISQAIFFKQKEIIDRLNEVGTNCPHEDPKPDKLEELREWVEVNSIHNHIGYANIVDTKALLDKIKSLEEE
jgi:hypothetical protein